MRRSAARVEEESDEGESEEIESGSTSDEEEEQEDSKDYCKGLAKCHTHRGTGTLQMFQCWQLYIHSLTHSHTHSLMCRWLSPGGDRRCVQQALRHPQEAGLGPLLHRLAQLEHSVCVWCGVVCVW